jgi:hypothetical protein
MSLICYQMILISLHGTSLMEFELFLSFEKERKNWTH